MPETARHRGAALAVLSAASLMVVLDSSIVAVALPVIQTDLGFSAPGLAWVVNAYLVAFGGLLLLSGRLGDLVGRRKVFLVGIVVFTAASLAAGLSPNATALVVARFVQGVGGALTSAVVLGMIVTLYPEPRARVRAIGVYSFTQAAGASIGMVAGGALTQGLDWHWTFYINLPIGIAALVLTPLVVASDRGLGLRTGIDVLGALLVTAGVMLLVLGIVQAGDAGWTFLTIGTLVLAAVLLALFLVRQARTRTPLLPLRLLRVRAISGANLTMVVMVAGFLGFQFVTALYLQQVLGFDALTTGFAFVPTPVMIAAFSLGLADWLNSRFSPRAVLVAGLLTTSVAFLYLTQVQTAGGYASHVLPSLILMGAGAGMAIPALMGLAMSAATPDDSGVTSGLITTTQQVGGALGTAVLATAAATRTAEMLGGGASEKEALASGFRVAYGFSAGLTALAAILAAVLLGRRSAAAPADTAAEPVAS
ncbi:MFS transporter [Amycolatopsis sp. FU40]|uniref:MFS transporter n=1 Tax=Amycolatopsis sp. FU40 TaxID=2914159 RepID=UPI001F23E87B|nr:MFS transporter [Amycolatopsis sp. FU40]UKD58478.1 MFS transporter [Amycolatopsis sp. FU40]